MLCAAGSFESDVWSVDSEPTDQSTCLEVLSGISPQSSLAPIGVGFVLVKQRVTWPAGKSPVRKIMLSFSLTHGSAPKLSPAAILGPGAQPTRQVPPTVEFGRSGEPILLFWTRVQVEHGNKVGTSTGPRIPRYKWRCLLPEKRDRRHRVSYFPGRRSHD